jgi:hypothetical protein
LVPYDADRYNCLSPTQEAQPPPPHSCLYEDLETKGRCGFKTRKITIWYDDYVTLDLVTERYLFNNRRTRQWMEKENEWINLDDYRRQQQKEILTRYCTSPLSTVKDVLDPDALVLHPTDTFDILFHLTRKKVLSDVILWLFMRDKLPMSLTTDQGEYQSLWPEWAQATQVNDDAARVLMLASCSAASFPFELWWVVAAFLTDKEFVGYSRWKGESRRFAPLM